MAQKTESKTPAEQEAIPADTVEQITQLDRFAKRLLKPASDARVETLALQNSWKVQRRQGGETVEVTLTYHQVSIKQWQDMQDRAANILLRTQKFKDEMMAELKLKTKKKEPLFLDGIIANAKKEITKIVVETLAKSAEYYFDMKYTGKEDDEFYEYNYRDMVELITACQLRTENGDPNV